MSELSSLFCVYIPIQPHMLRWFDGSLLCFSMYAVGSGNPTKSCIPTGLVHLLVDYIKVTDNIFPIHIAQWIIVRKDDFLLFYSCRSTKLLKLERNFKMTRNLMVTVLLFTNFYACFSHFSTFHFQKCSKKVSEVENWFIYLSNKIQFRWTVFASLMRLQTGAGESITCVMSCWKNIFFKLFTSIQYMKQTWIFIFFLDFQFLRFYCSDNFVAIIIFSLWFWFNKSYLLEYLPNQIVCTTYHQKHKCYIFT